MSTSKKYIEETISNDTLVMVSRIVKRASKIAKKKYTETQTDRGYVLSLVSQKKYKQAQAYLERKGIKRHWKQYLKDTEPIYKKDIIQKLKQKL